MNKWSALSQDNLVVSLSLATALAILMSAAAAMWVWSLVSEGMPMRSIEGGAEIPSMTEFKSFSLSGPNMSANE